MRIFYSFLFVLIFVNAGFCLTKKTTDDIPASNEYLYRLSDRTMAISPSKFYSDTFKPVSYREAAVLFLQDKNYAELFGANDKIEIIANRVNNIYSFESDYNEFSNIVPLKFAKMSGFYSGEKDTRYYSSFGKKSEEKYYFDTSGYGFGYIGDVILGAYEIKFELNENEDVELSRFRVKKGFKHVGIEVMKDNIVVGPGYFGQLLVSDNIEPEISVLAKTEIPYNWGILGNFRWYLWNTWFDDDDRVSSDPKLLGMRLSLKPSKYFEIGATRISYYGGSGQPDYNSFKDYWKLFTAEDENTGNKWDTDQHFGLDLSIYVPYISKISPFDGMKLYAEAAWNDITAPWQEEDKGKTFALLGDSYVFGILLVRENMDIRLEGANIYRETYAHHNYPAGYTDNDYIIGHFIGRDAEMLGFELYYEFTEKLHGYFGDEHIERNLDTDDKQKENRAYVGGKYFFSNNLSLETKFTYINKNKINTFESPVNYQFEDKSEQNYYFNFELSYTF
ncbi:hypothetical protein Flexsi_0743 [Flexistipes sinusarabici DSM 4947]|uniref:Capsule assembly Wzi family protein n=1 Tax=Flexistipes sinusarabici (strain ATCC 49648 / DSM 4947 / MAS 10) TaxID=717231 RepID=F8E461_FLESM|nr:capsule assembly Wzi family protein [Flexistipes sinusarabici]AEI14414.1 hypothetical protein Flexsi_0743 [Flexistipes sinusarabici DSM 4947]